MRLWTFSISILFLRLAIIFLSRIGMEWPMHSGRIIFFSTHELFPRHEFNKCVRGTKASIKLGTFRVSPFLHGLCPTDVSGELRDIEICLRAMQSRLYHAGSEAKFLEARWPMPTKKRDWRNLRGLRLMCWSKRPESSMQAGLSDCNHPSGLRSGFHPIDLCLSLFPWALFGNKRAPSNSIPRWISRGSKSLAWSASLMGKFTMSTFLDQLVLEPAAFYVMDPWIHDFARLYRFTQNMAFFVTRAKSNLDYHPTLLTLYRSRNRITKRSDHFAQGSQKPLNSIRTTSANQFFDIGEHRRLIFLRQLCLTRPDDCSTLQTSMEDRVVLPKCIKQNLRIKAFLRHFRERLKNSNLDCHLCLSVGSDHQETTPNRANT